MEIIDELEVEKRGIYAGCVGYFTANGDMDSCIILRTSIIADGKMYVQAGAGIVADSVPEKEHDECVAKARALFRAAEEAVRFASGVGRGNSRGRLRFGCLRGSASLPSPQRPAPACDESSAPWRRGGRRQRRGPVAVDAVTTQESVRRVRDEDDSDAFSARTPPRPARRMAGDWQGS